LSQIGQVNYIDCHESGKINLGSIQHDQMSGLLTDYA